MMAGSRTLADYALIGERTGTAGIAYDIVSDDIRGDFNNIEVFSGTGKSTAGLTFVAIDFKPTKESRLQFWDYYAYDLLNIVYLEGEYVFSISKKQKVKFLVQYLDETDIESSYMGDISANLYGLKTVYTYGKSSIFAAYNSTGSQSIVNLWAGDPGFTSSIFSRNEYRADVDAYKIGFKQKLGDFVFHASYARYDKSKSPRFIGGVSSFGIKDAQATNFILTYSYKKNIKAKLFHVIRKSEFDGVSVNTREYNFTQNHTRIILNYLF